MHQTILHNGQLLNKLLNANNQIELDILLDHIHYFAGHRPEISTLVDVCRSELESGIKDWRKSIARYSKAVERITNTPSNVPKETTETLLDTLERRIKGCNEEIHFLEAKLLNLNTLYPKIKQAFKPESWDIDVLINPDRWDIDVLIKYVNRHYQ